MRPLRMTVGAIGTESPGRRVSHDDPHTEPYALAKPLFASIGPLSDQATRRYPSIWSESLSYAKKKGKRKQGRDGH